MADMGNACFKEWLANKGQENMKGEPEEALQSDGEKTDGRPQMWLPQTA